MTGVCAVERRCGRRERYYWFGVRQQAFTDKSEKFGNKGGSTDMGTCGRAPSSLHLKKPCRSCSSLTWRMLLYAMKNLKLLIPASARIPMSFETWVPRSRHAVVCQCSWLRPSYPLRGVVRHRIARVTDAFHMGRHIKAFDRRTKRSLINSNLIFMSQMPGLPHQALKQAAIL